MWFGVRASLAASALHLPVLNVVDLKTCRRKIDPLAFQRCTAEERRDGLIGFPAKGPMGVYDTSITSFFFYYGTRLCVGCVGAESLPKSTLGCIVWCQGPSFCVFVAVPPPVANHAM